MKETRCSAEAGLNNILIVKTSSLGDIIQSFPVVSYLKHKFPQCSIDWAVEEPFSELIDAHPEITRTLKVQTKKWRRGQAFREWKVFRSNLREVAYDLIIDLQGNLKSGILARHAKGKIRLGFGAKTAAEWPNIFFNNCRINPPEGYNIREDALNLVKLYLKDDAPFEDPGAALETDLPTDIYLKEDTLNVMVCPGARWINKQLSLETLSDFLKKLGECHFLFIWGNNEEKALVERLKFPNSTVVPRLPLAALQNLMAEVDLVIAMDSLPLHLAGTTKTATFSIFGPSKSAKYRPLGKHHHSFQGACPYSKTFTKRCPILRKCKTGACMKAISAEDLFQSFHEILKSVKNEEGQEP